MGQHPNTGNMGQHRTDPAPTTDELYRRQLAHDLAQKTAFLGRAARALDAGAPSDELGVDITNSRLPFNPERGDTIGVATAHTELARQTDQNALLLGRLQRLETELTTELTEKEIILKQLTQLVHQLDAGASSEVLDAIDQQTAARAQLLRYCELLNIN